jgi:DNA repair protein RecO (recombination protein O)
MNSFNTKAFVLKSINFGDADKIFTILSEDKGKISVSAKGVRKITSRRRGSLDTLNLVNLKVYDNGKGFNTIQEAAVVNSFGEIKKNIERTFSGYYLSEMISKNLQEDNQSKTIFDLFHKSLKMLSNIRVPNKVAVSYFEINFMKLMGYEIVLDRCSKCNRLLSDEWEEYKFNLFPAGLLCHTCGMADFKITDLTANVLNNLSRDVFNIRINHNTVDEMNRVLKSYIEETLGERIKTLEIKL